MYPPPEPPGRCRGSPVGLAAVKVLRSILGVVAGLIAISVIAEGIELLLVTVLHGGAVTDPDVYWKVRNRTPVLGLKLVYNTLAAGVGGYLVAWIAGHRHLAHGAALAIVQLVLFVWGMTASEYAGTTPAWVWITLCVTMSASILLGARLRAAGRRNTPRPRSAGSMP